MAEVQTAVSRRSRPVGGNEATLAERAATVIEHAIVTSALPPGSRLGIHELAARYDIGATPIREGLNRLTHRGLVVALGNRGFRVAETSRVDLEDIIRARLSLEVDALRLSIILGDARWEAIIVAALHEMKHFTRRSSHAFREGVDDFDAVHKTFHLALIGACGSRRIIDFCSQLFDQTYRYRRLMFTQMSRPGAEIDREHDELARLTICRDVDGACRRYHEHIQHSLLSLYPEAEPPPGPRERRDV